MGEIFAFLAEAPVLVVFLLVGIGSALGRVKVKGVSLGATGVLFGAMGLTAWAMATGARIELPTLIGDIGLVVFAFCIGLIAGPGFFGAMRTAWPLLLVTAALVVTAAVSGLFLGRALGFSPVTIAGTFAGALTSTPALAATGGSPEATVGYASAYIYGVVSAMVAIGLALRNRSSDADAPAALAEANVRVDTDAGPTVGELVARHGGAVVVSRLRSPHGADVRTVDADTVLVRGAVVTVEGPQPVIDAVVGELGHLSSVDIAHDHSKLDHRRMILSNTALAGRTIASLRLPQRFGATVARVRRGDVDMVASDDLVLHEGDRLRVVGPRSAMAEITAYIGDSERGIADLNPIVLGLGIAFGLALGMVQIPLPGGLEFQLGPAAGTLLVGIAFGRIGRVGRVVTTLPSTAAGVLADLGLIVFLAYAGTKAGLEIAEAVASGDVYDLLLLGFVMTTIVVVGTYVVARRVFRSGGTRLAGFVAGSQTNPALLAFANTRSDYDPRVAVAYSLIYPGLLVLKILIAQVMVTL